MCVSEAASAGCCAPTLGVQVGVTALIRLQASSQADGSRVFMLARTQSLETESLMSLESTARHSPLPTDTPYGQEQVYKDGSRAFFEKQPTDRASALLKAANLSVKLPMTNIRQYKAPPRRGYRAACLNMAVSESGR